MPADAPAEPTDHDVKSVSVELEIVRTDEEPPLPRRNPWRPTTLTVRKFLRIVHLVEEGVPVTRSCRSENISYQHFRHRVSRSPRLQQRLKEAENCRDQVFRAEALEAIRSAFPRNWVAAMTFLERRWPAEFALRKVDREDSEEALIGDKIPEDRVLQYAKIMSQEAKRLGEGGEPPAA